MNQVGADLSQIQKIAEVISYNSSSYFKQSVAALAGAENEAPLFSHIQAFLALQHNIAYLKRRTSV